MEDKIAFEHFLYGDEKEIVISDMEFCADRILMLPKIRPHQLEKAVRLSLEYCQIDNFRQILIQRSNTCPVLIYQLHKRGVINFEEIEPFLRSGKFGSDSLLLSYYFRKEINDFNSFIKTLEKPHKFIFDFQSDHIDELLEYGFLRSSIEYCLKYDVVNDLVCFSTLKEEAKWSSFEWSIMPHYFDLLSFSGFFGSIKCFKHLLMNGFNINDHVESMVVCSGCVELFHLCQGHFFSTPMSLCNASEFFNLPLLVFMLENGTMINSKMQYFRL